MLALGLAGAPTQATEAGAATLAGEAAEATCAGLERRFAAATAQGDPAAMWAAARGLVDRWEAIRGAPTDAARWWACHDATAVALRYLAARWHREGAAGYDEARLELAERAYRAYLAGFSADAYEVEYFFAELLVLRAQAASLGEQTGRRRTRPPRRCGAVGEPAQCGWWRAAQASFRRALERSPEGRHTLHAAFAQMLLTVWLTADPAASWVPCRINAEGVCIARPGPRWWFPCAEPDGPTPACLEHLKRQDRWPIVPFGGLGPRLPEPVALPVRP